MSGPRKLANWSACSLWIVGLALLVVGSLKCSAIYDAVDPSLAPRDARLAAALEAALAPGRSPPTQASELYPDLQLVVLEPDLSVDEFSARLRTVPGWDVIVVVCPYGSGRDIDLDSVGVHGSWLRRRISRMEGWPNEGIFIASVIRAEQVVSVFFVGQHADWGSFAVRR